MGGFPRLIDFSIFGLIAESILMFSHLSLTSVTLLFKEGIVLFPTVPNLPHKDSPSSSTTRAIPASAVRSLRPATNSV